MDWGAIRRFASEAWTKSVAGLCRLQIGDRASSSKAPHLPFQSCQAISTSHCSLKLDSSVCFQIDYSPALKSIQASKNQTIVSWNGNGRKQVIGAFNSNGMLVVHQPPGLLMGACFTYAAWLGHLFNVWRNGNGRK